MIVTVALFTYLPHEGSERAVYAQRTLIAALNHLKFGGDLRFHIADDGSHPGHVENLMAIVKRHTGKAPTTSDGKRGGYGASWNAMTGVVHQWPDDKVLCLEDDWVLLEDLDLDPLVTAMDASNGDLRCVRLGYLGWTDPLFGELLRWEGQTFLMLDPDSPEKHVFSGGPRLETVAFQRTQGEWPVGLGAGDTELAVCGRRQSRVGVAWPLDIGITADIARPSKFAHIGTETVKNAPLGVK